MKKVLLIVMLTLIAVSAQAADVGVSISVGQPGFYGRIDIGDYPRPEVIYTRPVVVHRAPVHVVHEPVYLHVPPGHQKKWSKHCRKYNACDRPVYFVKDRWYNKVYVPHYQARHHGGKSDKHNRDRFERGGGNGHGHGPGHGGGHGRGHDR
jgi:hypothetical protein